VVEAQAAHARARTLQKHAGGSLRLQRLGSRPCRRKRRRRHRRSTHRHDGAQLRKRLPRAQRSPCEEQRARHAHARLPRQAPSARRLAVAELARCCVRDTRSCHRRSARHCGAPRRGCSAATCATGGGDDAGSCVRRRLCSTPCSAPPLLQARPGRIARAGSDTRPRCVLRRRRFANRDSVHARESADECPGQIRRSARTSARAARRSSAAREARSPTAAQWRTRRVPGSVSPLPGANTVPRASSLTDASTTACHAGVRRRGAPPPRALCV
jgi:hypothetical protein